MPYDTFGDQDGSKKTIKEQTLGQEYVTRLASSPAAESFPSKRLLILKVGSTSRTNLPQTTTCKASGLLFRATSNALHATLGHGGWLFFGLLGATDLVRPQLRFGAESGDLEGALKKKTRASEFRPGKPAAYSIYQSPLQVGSA